MARQSLLAILFITLLSSVKAQPPVTAADSFFTRLQQHCGFIYEGVIKAGGRAGDGFTGEKLYVQLLSCQPDALYLPFYAGSNKSRTWIIKKAGSFLRLKHIHMHEDGSEDKVSGYGGTATNSGNSNIQVFPADAFTCNLLPYACSNVWWFTLTDEELTYNLRRMGSDRVFTVSFNLKKPVQDMPLLPWGWDKQLGH